MQSIGERLQEARKKLGVSIQDAANETKIRQHFLLGFENNNFDIGLPEIYCKGFLKIYTNFLNIDSERILADYQAIRLSSEGEEDLSNKEFLGHIKLEEKQPENNNRHIKDKPAEHIEEENDSEQPSPLVTYRKPLIIGACSFAGVLLIALIVNLVSTPSTTNINSDLATFAEDMASNNDEQIVLIAKDDVHVIVRQEMDKKRLYSGTLTKGQKIPLVKRGQIKIRFNEGDNLILEKNGKQYSMNAQGVAVRTFD